MRAAALVFSVILAAAIPVSATAQTEKSQLAKCASLEGAVERLACFDALSKKPAVRTPAPAKTPPRSTGRWRVSSETSPIDDSKNVYLMLDSRETITGLLRRVRPTLILRCKERDTDVYIDWGVYLGLDETDVLLRMDDEEAFTLSWGISTDNEASFFRGDVAEMIKALMARQKLLAQVTPYGESPATVTFQLAGLARAVKPLQEACGLK